MPFFALISEDCHADAERAGFQSEVQALANKVERDQSIASWDRFPAPCVKKSLGTFRLVAAETLLGEDRVISLLALMARGGKRYSQFKANPPAFVAELLPSRETLGAWVATRSQDLSFLPPPPSVSEYPYLYVSAEETADRLIYETQEWVQRVREMDSAGFSWIHGLLLSDVLSKRTGDAGVAAKGSARVAYRRFPELNRVLLIAPFFGLQQADTTTAIEARYADLLRAPGLDDQDLRKRSARAYPELVLAEEATWLAVQRDERANLALSPEEGQILNSVLHYNENGAYPLFINGRPGSGKSTILQYLLAHHLFAHLARAETESLPHPPLYLTYSKRLLNEARAHVESILRFNVQNLLASNTPPIEQIRSVMDLCFGQFPEFLRSLLPPEQRSEFAWSRRVDFATFRRLWEPRARATPDLRRLSPELVWHVIRSFIKGRRNDDGAFCDPERYEELPAKQRSITMETFAIVFHEVWESWYRGLRIEQGLWDDQDLARQVLDDADPDISRYPAVFCDEAQDFTRIELELILRLSLFSRRLVPSHELGRVPFAFAGDPFQTINPTGFQWSSVQAGFHEQIVQVLDRYGTAKLRFNYHELSSNYRSTKSIVGFCNLLQLIRGILFEIPDLRPQTAWFADTGRPPELASLEDPEVQESLRTGKDLVVILPCQEGLEEEYVSKDAFLRTLVVDDAARNFLSPMAAKGLEFRNVVLYKFGAECLADYAGLFDHLRPGSTHAADPEKALPYEYFLNRLYVAASRPQKRLFIVDTVEAVKAIWTAPEFRDREALLARYRQEQGDSWDPDLIVFPEPGPGKDWAEEGDDPLVLGQKFRDEGLATNNTYLLRLAEDNYRRAGRSKDALHCLAVRSELDRRFKQAAEAYRERGDTSEVLRCLWKGGLFSELSQCSELTGLVEFEAARFVTGGRSGPEAERFLLECYAAVNAPRRPELSADPRWEDICKALIQALGANVGQLKEPVVCYSQLEKLFASGMRVEPEDQVAKIAFAANRYAEAINHWERSGVPPSLKQWPMRHAYSTAKARVEQFPLNLRWLSEIEDYQGIVGAVQRHPAAVLGTDDAGVVVDAYIAMEESVQAAKFAEDHPSRLALLRRLLDRLPAGTTDEGASYITFSLIQGAMQSQAWDLLPSVIRMLRDRGHGMPSLQEEFLYLVANSTSLTHNAPADARDTVARYVRDAASEHRVWDDYSVRLFGAALERTDRLIDSLEFYEDVWKHQRLTVSNQARRDAEARWCKCKHRQAEYSRRQGKLKEAERQDRELARVLKDLGRGVSEIPDYPEIQREERRPLNVTGIILADVTRSAILDLRRSASRKYSAEDIAQLLHVPVASVRAVLAEEGLS